MESSAALAVCGVNENGSHQVETVPQCICGIGRLGEAQAALLGQKTRIIISIIVFIIVLYFYYGIKISLLIFFTKLNLICGNVKCYALLTSVFFLSLLLTAWLYGDPRQVIYPRNSTGSYCGVGENR